MKSDEFLCDLYRSLGVDLGLEEQDILTLVRRIRCEGTVFVSEVLPSLAKATLSALESKLFVCPTTFGKAKTSVLPLLLGQHFRVLFYDHGGLRPVSRAQASALYTIRQVCELCYKAKLPYSAEKEQSVLSKFIEVEEEIKANAISFDDPMLDLASEFISKLFKGFEFYPDGFFGPGVCCDAKQWEKHGASRIDSPALRHYHDSYFFDSRHKVERASTKMTHSSLFNSELYAQVILVPKDSRGPRLICAEPTTNQWIQMPLMRQIVDLVENHPLTSCHVNFKDQTINGALALENSETRYWATLDLKDASDRVRLDLVKFLFKDTTVLKPLLACRTPRALVVDKMITLRKFAPMGSACCFPVMALVIWAISSASISMARNSIIYNNIYVYGDDLVVPTSDVFVVRQALNQVGLRLNEQKCYDEAYFRESCGVDAYFGVNVTPVRLRNFPVADCPVKQTVSHLIDFANELDELPTSQGYIRQVAEKLLGKPIAYSARRLPGTFWVDEYSTLLKKNLEGRYVIKSIPLTKERACSEYDLLPIALQRVGREDVNNDVSAVDLRKQKYSVRKIRVTEWRIS